MLNSFAESVEEQQNVHRIKSKKLTYEVTFYYPEQYEVLRMINNISLQQWIKSTCTCEAMATSGGKSGAVYFMSADNLFVFKRVKVDEFFMFYDFAPLYFKHLYENTC
jgi:predicted cupin superfamily sugar epimerase